ncbi:MAG: outer-membrane lipoprotein carrier protein LolA [Deltaproteobacteria bacterium]|nr:outer-membrane lipoprotein carrier protein LolA [Deltaproteobacteria bacterium]
MSRNGLLAAAATSSGRDLVSFCPLVGFTLRPVLAAAAVMLVLLGWFFPLAQASADAQQTEAALAGLSERYRALNTFVADYTRTATTPSTDVVFSNQATQTATGVLSWKTLSQLRLDQKKPDEQAMMTDGQTVWWYVPEEKQVYVYRDIDLAEQLSPLLSFMAGLEALNDQFVILEAAGQDVREGEIGLILEGKQEADQIADRLIIYCDQQYQLTGFRLISLTGEKTDFFLSKIRVNTKLNDSFFVFKIPRGVEVVEEE